MLTPDSPLVLVGQVLFFGGLVLLMFGLPVFLWLFVRACRDLHRIADEAQHLSARYDVLTHSEFVAPAPKVQLSQFGR